MLKLQKTSTNQRILGIGLLVILIDQLVKWLVRSQELFFVINKGGAFSFGANYWWFKWIVGGSFILLVFGIGCERLNLRKHKSQISNKYQILNIYTSACIFLLAGAASNLIDRIYFGGVIDYISIGPFPVFNLADIFINLAIGLLIWSWWQRKKVYN